MKKLLFVFGTRPEAIKMLPIVLLAQTEFRDSFEVKVCVTGQHREMLDQVLSLFDVTPDYDLSVMSLNQSLSGITSRIILGLEPVLKEYRPDCLLVHGDTTTTFASSLAAYYQKITVAHIEAGLRTNNIYSPWPEELNRRLTSVIAQYHFAPTQQSKDNLKKENVTQNVAVVGNTVIDSLLWVVNKINCDQALRSQLEQEFIAKGVNFNHKIILITAHRRENFGSGFINICQAIKQIALDNPEVQIVYPVHLNPNVRTPVLQILAGIANIQLIDPLEYVQFVYLMSKAYIILTDSGGIQEEAPSLQKPVLVMRDTTERPEAVEAGAVKLVGTNKDIIIKSVTDLLHNQNSYKSSICATNPYGSGDSARQILDYLRKRMV